MTIIQGDAHRLPLADSSVDLVVTSPPYFSLRSYTDGGKVYVGQVGSESTPQDYIAGLLTCTREWMRVLKSSGSIFVNLGDKYSGAQSQNIGGVSRAVGIPAVQGGEEVNSAVRKCRTAAAAPR